MKDKEGQVKVRQKIFLSVSTHGSSNRNQLAEHLAEGIQVYFSAISYCTGCDI